MSLSKRGLENLGKKMKTKGKLSKFGKINKKIHKLGSGQDIHELVKMVELSEKETELRNQLKRNRPNTLKKQGSYLTSTSKNLSVSFLKSPQLFQKKTFNLKNIPNSTVKLKQNDYRPKGKLLSTPRKFKGKMGKTDLPVIGFLKKDSRKNFQRANSSRVKDDYQDVTINEG
jgi:hypothetical protein